MKRLGTGFLYAGFAVLLVLILLLGFSLSRRLSAMRAEVQKLQHEEEEITAALDGLRSDQQS